MKNEMRISAVISIAMIGVLAVAGIISYVIIKRRRKGVETIETVNSFTERKNDAYGYVPMELLHFSFL